MHIKSLLCLNLIGMLSFNAVARLKADTPLFGSSLIEYVSHVRAVLHLYNYYFTDRDRRRP